MAAVAAFCLPIAIAVVAVVTLAGRDGGSGETSRSAVAGAGAVHRYSIPEGTKARMDVGYPVPDVMPEIIDLVAGDTVEVENLDVATHTFGPLTVRPGETTRLTFDEPGYYFGICTVGKHDTVTIIVR